MEFRAGRGWSGPVPLGLPAGPRRGLCLLHPSQLLGTASDLGFSLFKGTVGTKYYVEILLSPPAIIYFL